MSFGTIHVASVLFDTAVAFPTIHRLLTAFPLITVPLYQSRSAGGFPYTASRNCVPHPPALRSGRVLNCLAGPPSRRQQSTTTAAPLRRVISHGDFPLFAIWVTRDGSLTLSKRGEAMPKDLWERARRRDVAKKAQWASPCEWALSAEQRRWLVPRNEKKVRRDGPAARGPIPSTVVLKSARDQRSFPC